MISSSRHLDVCNQRPPRRSGSTQLTKLIGFLVSVGIVVAMWWAGAADSHANYPGIAFSFTDDDSGGIALTVVDAQTGDVTPPKRIFDSKRCRKPLKVRRAKNGFLAVTNIAEDQPALFVVNPERRGDNRQLRLPGVPDECRFIGNVALVTCDDDSLAIVDTRTNRIHVNQLDETLVPPANGPEDICLSPNNQYAVVSFQKDSKKGKKLGSRLAIFELPQVKLVADLQLPRNRPELHVEGNLKEQGPGPEVIHISNSTDTLTTTLDLYGGVGLLNWSAAKAGRLESWTTVSTSPQNSWGTAFPDRATLFTYDDRDLLFVCNAGVNGGCCLIDLALRRVIWRHQVPPGLEAPVYIPALKSAYSVCSGKVKQRLRNTIVKHVEPRKILVHFDFTNLNQPHVETIQLPVYTTQIRATSLAPPMLLIAGGTSKQKPNELISFDPVENVIKDRELFDAGRIFRFER